MPFVGIKLGDIVFDKKVQTYCNNPKFQCPNYNHSWACPPEAPYLEEEVSTYRQFFLIYYQLELEPYIKKVQFKHPKRSRQRILNSLYWKGFVRDKLEREMYDFLEKHGDEYQEMLTLWDGFCRVCYNPEGNRCTYDTGEPCRYPNKKRYSMEAVGIDVNATAKNVSIDLEWPPVNYVYRFGLVCFK